MEIVLTVVGVTVGAVLLLFAIKVTFANYVIKKATQQYCHSVHLFCKRMGITDNTEIERTAWEMLAPMISQALETNTIRDLDLTLGVLYRLEKEHFFTTAYHEFLITGQQSLEKQIRLHRM